MSGIIEFVETHMIDAYLTWKDLEGYKERSKISGKVILITDHNKIFYGGCVYQKVS